MRGCLSFLLFVLVLVAALVWFAVPPGADWLVTRVVQGAIGGDVHVHLTADPPPRLLLLRADSLRIDGTGVSFGGGSISAGNLSLTLEGVDLAGRQAASLTGTLDGMTVAGAGVGGAALPVRHVDLAGSLSRLQATLTIDGGTVQSVATARIQQVAGVPVTTVTLVGPDLLAIAVAGQAFTARLAVSNGDLVARPLSGSLAPVTIVNASQMHPFTLTAVRVSGPDLVVTGSLDRAALGF